MLASSSAKVLDCLAGRQRSDLNLVAEAARWYGVASAAGHLESGELLDALLLRHDPAQPGGTGSGTDAELAQAESRPAELWSAQACPLGGLAEVMQCQLTAATMHVGTCRPCQKELLDHGGILPVMHRKLVRIA